MVVKKVSPTPEITNVQLVMVLRWNQVLQSQIAALAEVQVSKMLVTGRQLYRPLVRHVQEQEQYSKVVFLVMEQVLNINKQKKPLPYLEV